MSRNAYVLPSPTPKLTGGKYVDLAADAAEGQLVELYTGGSVATADFIGAWRKTSGVMLPQGEIDFTKATDTREGLATDATSDNTISVDSPGNFAIGDEVSAWRLSTNTQVTGARLVIGKVGSVLTLSGGAFTHAIGDLLITANEFGPLLTQANGGLWVPVQAGVHPRWNAGLDLQAALEGDGVFLFMLGNSGTATQPRDFDIRARLEMNEVAAGLGSGFGLGWKSTGVFAGGGGGLYNSGGPGPWNRGAWAGNPKLPAWGFTATNPTVGPGVGTAFVDWHVGSIGNGTQCSYDTRVHSRDSSGALVGNLQGGDSYTTTAIAWTGIGAGATGPLEGVHLLASLKAGGSLGLVVKEIESHWTIS